MAIDMRFHSIQMFVHEMRDLAWYKEQEDKYNELMPQLDKKQTADKMLYKTVFGSEPPEFVPQGQDIIHQLISGAGWRIKGWNESSGTISALIMSSDERGVKFMVTAHVGGASGKAKKTKGNAATEYEYFSADRASEYFEAQRGRAGIGTLCFEVDEGVIATIKKNYEAKHPKLFKSHHEYPDLKILTVYAYYLKDSDELDPGTTLRFIERNSLTPKQLLPGFEGKNCDFGVPSEAYFDHWVSNVFDRKQFINTLADCLGFSPKVDFNAGVVAAGEAIIESTVIGNDSKTKALNEKEILVDQSQVFLPINNALSEVGHVHMYLEEIGQGIQHIASRVPDILYFISRCNKFRESTGHGFSFLNIPRSYYGRLVVGDLATIEGVSAKLADAVMEALHAKELMDDTGIVLLDLTDEQVRSIASSLPAELQKEFSGAVADNIVQVVRKSRFLNMTKLLGEHFSDDTYLNLVKNKILIDIQGKDVLYQIFSANILQEKNADEAPFLEFIQRVCSEAKGEDGKPLPIRPGCGGFGIRNFLTLFLSIEVNKAMDGVKNARKAGDQAALKLAQKQVDTLTAQLDESNPILTAISDAMTAEADCLAGKDKAGAAKYLALKEAAQQQLQDCSAKYKAAMQALRTAEPQVLKGGGGY